MVLENSTPRRRTRSHQVLSGVLVIGKPVNALWSARPCPRYISPPLMGDPRSSSTSDRVREGASPLRQQLKRETAELHRRLEIDLGLLESELSLDHYRRILEFIFGFYAPIEVGLARVASAGPPLGLPLRARARLI